MRNTKVVDIIDELKSYGCQVDVYDPWVDPKEYKKSYKHGVISDPFLGSKQYDAVVTAVAHKQFRELTMDDYRSITSDTPVLIDVKGIIESPSWRL